MKASPRILIAFLVVASALVLGFYLKIIRPGEAHARALERIANVIHRHDRPLPPGLDYNSWHNYVGAVHDSVYNYFLRPQYYPTAKLEEIAAQFESKWPKGPQDTADIAAMLDLLVAARPDLADFTPVLAARSWMKEEAGEKAAALPPGK